jgi:hypothetical protein
VIRKADVDAEHLSISPAVDPECQLRAQSSELFSCPLVSQHPDCCSKHRREPTALSMNEAPHAELGPHRPSRHPYRLCILIPAALFKSSGVRYTFLRGNLLSSRLSLFNGSRIVKAAGADQPSMEKR